MASIEDFYGTNFKPEKSIQDLCDSVLMTLKYWHSLHTDCQVWAENWLLEMDPLEWLNETDGIMSNSYFNVNVKDNILIEWAAENIHLFSICNECNAIIDNKWDECSCDSFDYDNLRKLNDNDINDLLLWLDEINCGTLPNDITDRMVFNAMMLAFDVYSAALKDYIAEIIEDIELYINQIEGSANNGELLVNVLSAMQVYHLNGNVMEDYGDMFNLDRNFAYDVRNNGLTEYYDQDDIDHFIGTDY